MSSKNIVEPEKVQLFIGIMYTNPELLDKAVIELEKHYGVPTIISEEYSFSSITEYYDKEMGSGIKKKIYAYGMIEPQDIVSIKILTNDIEKSFSVSGSRKINIDPGYLTVNQLVLVSSKNRARRIYLDKGIYAELTLLFMNNGWKTFEWTYADFRKPEVQEFLVQLRKKYLNAFKITKTSTEDTVNGCELVGAMDKFGDAYK